MDLTLIIVSNVPFEGLKEGNGTDRPYLRFHFISQKKGGFIYTELCRKDRPLSGSERVLVRDQGDEWDLREETGTRFRGVNVGPGRSTRKLVTSTSLGVRVFPDLEPQITRCQ